MSSNAGSSRIIRKAFLAAMAGCVAAPFAAQAKVFVTLDEALSQAFPAARKCQTRTENRYLTPAQLQQVQELSGAKEPSALVVRYLGSCGGKPAGIAYTDTHRVRTHPETLFIVVDPQRKISRVEVLSFDEPLDYKPRENWYATFQGASLDPDLAIQRRIPLVTGASLTSRATAQAARRALALDRVLAR